MKTRWTLMLILAVAAPACSRVDAVPDPTPTIPPKPSQTTIDPTPKAIPVFEGAPCPFDAPEDAPVECGFVIVPEDHNAPEGPSLRLATVIVRDQSEDHQPDPVFLLAGGPGERVVANAPALAAGLTPLHPNRDLIIFDQRGVGESEPALECPEFVDALYDILDEADADAATLTVFDGFMACRDRLLEEEQNLAVYTTAQSAADIESIREALGYDEINLYGGSYGSLLAQATMRDYPDKLRSVAFNSTLPLESSLFVDASTTTAHAILRFVEACAADGACDEAFPNLKQVLFEVIDRLNAAPVPITVTDPMDGESYPAVLTGDAVRANLVSFLYISQIIPVLPQAIYDVYEGDYELMVQLSSTRLALLDLISRGMTTSVICNADLVGRTPQDLIEVTNSLPRQLVSTVDIEITIEHGMFGICENWPVPVAEESAKDPLISDIPTLVLEGEFDPVTPPEYGRLVAGYLENGYYFEFAGIGHDVVSSECARRIAGEFIANPVQEPDAACIAEMPGVAFDVPGTAVELALEPFVDQARGFQGLVPTGWTELAPANLARGANALDPTYFVLEASDLSADDLFAALAGQLGLDPIPDPRATTEIGSFLWELYSFERPGGNLADLALAEDGAKAYFVYLVSSPADHEQLFEELFLPAVEAMAPTG